MQPLSAYVAALAVAIVFYVWRGYRCVLSRRQRVMRERVAYMLWVVADKIDRNSRMLRRLTPS